MIIGRVVPGSIAARHGIQPGDSIVGGADARGRRVAFGQTGPDGFGRLVGQDSFTLFVYRRGVAEQRPMELRISRKAAKAKKPATRPTRDASEDSRWIGSGGGAAEKAPAKKGSAPRVTTRPSTRSSATKSTVEMTRHVFRDQGFGGMESHVMLLPKGWSVRGGSLWTPTETIVNHFAAIVDAGDGRMITWDRARSFSFSQDPLYQQAIRRQGQRAMASFVAPPSQVGEAARNVLLRIYRPQARNARVLETKRDHASEQVLARMVQKHGLDNKTTVDMAVLRYEEGGRAYEEMFWYPLSITRMAGVGFSGAPTYMWSIFGSVSYRAPAGQLQSNFKLMAMVAQSLKSTPRWSICKGKLLAEISRIRHRGAQERMRIMRESSRQIAKSISDVSDSQMASWRRQQAMKDEGHRKAVNGISEVHDYQSRDGHSFALDHSYKHVFEHKSGRILMTNDEFLADKAERGGDFDRMKRIR